MRGAGADRCQGGKLLINPIKLFFGFDGRISRRWFWIGLIAIAALSPFSIWTAMSGNPFMEALPTVRKLGPLGVLWVMALFYPLAALIAKRLHDRGKSGWLALLFYLPALIATMKFLQFYRLEMAQIDQYLSWVIWWFGAAGLWFLIELGFFGSKSGANKYGPEPGT